MFPRDDQHIGSDNYWNNCAPYVTCPDVVWQWMHDSYGNPKVINAMSTTDETQAGVNPSPPASNIEYMFNSALAHGEKLIILYVGANPVKIGDLIHEIGWRYGFFRKFEKRRTCTEYWVYLGGDPSDPNSWGSYCYTICGNWSAPYEVFP